MALAGCGSIAVGGPSPEPDGTTVTPAPIPTERPTPTPVDQLAPGLTGNGVVDPLALAEAHESVLSVRSETVRLRRDVRYVNGELRSRRVQVTRVSANRQRFHTAITVGGSYPPFAGDRLEFYSNGNLLLQATFLPDHRSFFRLPLAEYREQNDVDVVISSPDAGTVYLLFAVVETRVTARVDRPDGTRYRVRGTQLVRPGTLAEAEDVRDPRNVSLSAVIDERGVVLDFTLRYDARIGNRSVTVVSSGTHTAIGNTTVPRPPWVATALNRTA